MLNIFFLSKIVPFIRHVEQYCTARGATDGNITRAYCLYAGYLGLETHSQNM